MLSTVKDYSLREDMIPHPILYSLQNCPYAIRARIGILLAKQPVILRAIALKRKPAEMLEASPKGSVPVLVLDKYSVIDESLDIMIWALHQNDPDNLLYHEQPKIFSEILTLINRFDNEFKDWLEKYKCAKRYHETSQIDYRQQCELFILDLEARLTAHDFLMGANPSLVDYAILPFIRQFARVDRKWYIQAPYPKLQHWLKAHLQSQVFSKAMTKYPLWLDNHETILFGVDNIHE
jgi:glutathione S-transferase